MQADSVLEAIETNTVARLLLVEGVKASKACAAADMFKPLPQTDGSIINEPTVPDDYPGTVTSIVDDQIEIVANVNQSLGSATFAYRVPVFVALYVTSDGSVAGGSKRLAWKIAEAIQRDLVLFVPDNGPAEKPAGTTLWPLEPAEFESILADETTYGILMKFWAQYQIGVVTS